MEGTLEKFTLVWELSDITAMFKLICRSRLPSDEEIDLLYLKNS